MSSLAVYTKMACFAFQRGDLQPGFNFPRPIRIFQIPVDEAIDPCLQAHHRLPAKQARRFANIGPTGAHVSRLGGGKDEVGAFVKPRLDEPDGFEQRAGLIRSKVDDLVAHWLETGNGATRNIIDKGEVAHLLSVAEDGHRPIFGNPLDKAEKAHVGPSGRAIHSEVAKDGHIEIVEIMIGVAKHLRRFFRGCIGRQGKVGVGIFAIRHRIVAPVEARGGGKNELRDTMAAALLQEVEGSRRIRVDVDPGIDHGLPDARAGGQVDHSVKGRRLLSGSAVKECRHRTPVADVDLCDPQVIAVDETGRAPRFQADVVGMIELVDGHHGVAVLDQTFTDSGADKTGSAGHKNTHGCTLSVFSTHQTIGHSPKIGNISIKCRMWLPAIHATIEHNLLDDFTRGASAWDDTPAAFMRGCMSETQASPVRAEQKNGSSALGLDELLQVTGPRIWIALIALLVIVGGTLFWSIIGVIPLIVPGEGLLLRGDVQNVTAPDSGSIKTVNVKEKSQVQAGDVVATLLREDGVIVDLKASQAGVVTGINIPPGFSVAKGAALMTIENVSVPLIAVIYVPLVSGKKVSPGMEVQLSPWVADVNTYGYLLGTVQDISEFPVTQNDIVGSGFLGKGFATQLLNSSQPNLQMIVQLDPATGNQSGYRWSSSSGPDFQLQNGTATGARVLIGQSRPIDYFLPLNR